MHTGRFWDPSTKKHSSGEGPGGRSYSALPLDWDADGDYDLLIGTDAGTFFLRVNEGTKSKAAFSTTNQPVLAAGAPAAVSKYAMPVAADWDGDGDMDLLVGDHRFTMTGGKYVGSGYVWLFRRRGAPAESAQGVSAGRR